MLGEGSHSHPAEAVILPPNHQGHNLHVTCLVTQREGRRGKHARGQQEAWILPGEIQTGVAQQREVDLEEGLLGHSGQVQAEVLRDENVSRVGGNPLILDTGGITVHYCMMTPVYHLFDLLRMHARREVPWYICSLCCRSTQENKIRTKE